MSVFLGLLFVYGLWLIKNIYNYIIFDFLLWKTDREIDHVAALFLSVQVDEDKVKFMQGISACISLCQFRSLFTDNLYEIFAFDILLEEQFGHFDTIPFVFHKERRSFKFQTT